MGSAEITGGAVSGGAMAPVLSPASGAGSERVLLFRLFGLDRQRLALDPLRDCGCPAILPIEMGSCGASGNSFGPRPRAA